MTIQANTLYNDCERNTSPNPVVLRVPGAVSRGDGLARGLARELARERGSLAPGPGEGPSVQVSQSDRRVYKGGTDQMFVTYEVEEVEFGGDSEEDDSCPQVTRVYLPGDLCNWEIGVFKTRSGADVYGVKIEYQQTHETYRARDQDTEYECVTDTRRYAKIIELPRSASAIDLRAELPDRYRQALHRL